MITILWAVSKDIKQYLARRWLIFVPTSDILKKALDMMEFNASPSITCDNRKRFEVRSRLTDSEPSSSSNSAGFWLRTLGIRYYARNMGKEDVETQMLASFISPLF